MNSEKKSGHIIRDIVPVEFTNAPVIQLITNRRLTVEGCKGIEEYSDITIKIKTADGIAAAYGSGLNIKFLSTTAVIVEGRINRVEFEDWR